ncbi:MAG: PepSY domain-containing protein [Pseudomonadota bacterium]
MTSKIINLFIITILIVGAFFLGSYANIFDMDSNESDIRKAKLAKVNLSEAVEKVTEAHNGVVITAILEEKKEGALIYEIDLIDGEKEVEVWVDAITGQMSEVMMD